MAQASGDPLLGVLGPGGGLARSIDAYEHRPEQLEMARAVARAFDKGEYLLVEAGTGTGKTLAYLLPAALSGKRVVVSTATKTLQEQIYFKDIPLLRRALGRRLAATYLKGRQNYLCLARYERFDASPRFVSREEGSLYRRVKEWAGRTETGDRAELDLPDQYEAWRGLSTDSDGCLGQKCSFYETCFVTRMRERAKESDIVVVNHHLFFADLAVKSKPGAQGGEVLPRYDAAVFDEAHAIEGVATEFFGSAVSSYRVDELRRDGEECLPEEDPRHKTLSGLLGRLKAEADFFFKDIARVTPRGSGAVRLSADSLKVARTLQEDLGKTLDSMSALLSEADIAEASALARRAGELKADLDFICAARDPAYVYFAEARARGVALRAAPIDVAEELRRNLYPHLPAAAFTSATLSSAGDFAFFKQRLGLEALADDAPAVRTLALQSPFDYAKQAALYLPKHLPDPSDTAFVAEAAKEIEALCAITGGRAFALFTSLKNMKAAHALLADALPYRVLLQGEKPKGALLEEFREEPSVLFATQSFWEGVDVPGEALSLVIIDKLPFDSPGDPLVSARIDLLRSRGEEPFNSYQVPSASLALRQGFGRLIRTRQDRGVVAVLDRRIVTKGYGRTFIQNLPPCTRFGEIAELSRWWEQDQGGAGDTRDRLLALGGAIPDAKAPPRRRPTRR